MLNGSPKRDDCEITRPFDSRQEGAAHGQVVANHDEVAGDVQSPHGRKMESGGLRGQDRG